MNQTNHVDWHHETGPDGEAVPFAEIDGGTPGPTWLLTGGVHGDEYEGPEAVRRTMRDLVGRPFAGKVIGLPVVNPRAYAAGSRCTPGDGGNLNRLFPGDPGGNWTSRWAAFIWKRFVSRADQLVDLHSGGVSFEFETVAGFHDDADQPLASTFGTTLWRMPPTPGVFSYEFRQRRGPAIGIELSYGGGRHEFPVELARVALINLVTGKIVRFREPVHDSLEVHTPAGGEWTPDVRLRQRVREGDVLGHVHDWTGHPVTTIVAPARGKVLALRRLVSVRTGDMVVMLGLPESKRDAGQA